MMDLNTIITGGDSTHYDPTLSSISRPTTPTNLFDFELGNLLFFVKVHMFERVKKLEQIVSFDVTE